MGKFPLGILIAMNVFISLTLCCFYLMFIQHRGNINTVAASSFLTCYLVGLSSNK